MTTQFSSEAVIKNKGLLPATASAGLGRQRYWHSTLLLRGIPPPTSAICLAMADGIKKEDPASQCRPPPLGLLASFNPHSAFPQQPLASATLNLHSAFIVKAKLQ